MSPWEYSVIVKKVSNGRREFLIAQFQRAQGIQVHINITFLKTVHWFTRLGLDGGEVSVWHGDPWQRPDTQLPAPHFFPVREICTDTLVAAVEVTIERKYGISNWIMHWNFFSQRLQSFSAVLVGLYGILITGVDIQLSENGEFSKLTSLRPFSFSDFRIYNFLFHYYSIFKLCKVLWL